MSARAETATTPAVVVAGCALADLVAGEPAVLRLVGGRRGSHAYLRLAPGRRLLAVEAHGGIELPIAVSVPSDVVDLVHDARRVAIGRGALVVDDAALPIGHLRDDRSAFAFDAAGARAAARAIESALGHHRPPAEPPAVTRAVASFGDALVRTPCEALDAARGLVGLGLGSTPSGDDVVAAAAATLASLVRGRSPLAPWAVGALAALDPVLGAVEASTTPLSAELLALAARGHMLPRLRAVLAAAGHGDAGKAVDALVAVGHSSGYFLATGAALALAAAASNDNTERTHAKSP